MERFQKIFNAGHWRTLQAICACSQICNWSTQVPRNSIQLLNVNTTKFQVEREPVKRMCKVKQRRFKRAKKSKKSRDWERYVAHKKATASALKAARWDHLNGILQTRKKH